MEMVGDVRLPQRTGMKEEEWIKPGVEGRDERDADNTSCNIDEGTFGKGGVVVETLPRRPAVTSDLF